MPADPRRTAAIADVRRAYRLLWAYQRQILDTIKIIEGAFPNHGFEWWNNRLYNLPTRGRNPARHWAWDLLPFYNISAFYLPAGPAPRVPAPEQWMLQIRIISDDAYESYEGKGERDARGFADAAGSRSSLALLGWKCTGQYDGPWIDGLWNHAEYPDGDGKASVQSDPPVSVVRKTFDIADLGTREEVERAVEAFKGVLRRELGLIVP